MPFFYEREGDEIMWNIIDLFLVYWLLLLIACLRAGPAVSGYDAVNIVE